MVKFSVIYLTYRPGGYELLAASLENQTCQDYELICVDEMTQFADIRREYLRDHGVKLSVISPSKKKCFSDIAFNLMNAYNTGVLLSRGDYVIISNDYTLLPNNALEKWEAHEADLKNNIAISGSAMLIGNLPKPANMNHPISIWNEDIVDVVRNTSPAETRSWVPTVFEMFYSAFSYDLLVKMNGFGEYYDYHRTMQVEGALNSIRSVHGRTAVDPSICCAMINHRKFDSGSEGLWHASKIKQGGQTICFKRPNCFDLKTHRRGTIPEIISSTLPEGVVFVDELKDESRYVCMDHYIDRLYGAQLWSIMDVERKYITKLHDRMSSLHTTRRIEYPWAILASNPKPDDKVLDVGCGNSPLGISFAAIGCIVTATDISDKFKPFYDELRKEEIEFVVDDITKTSIRGEFDIITCVGVLSGLPAADAIKAIENMERLCKDGGCIIITIDVSDRNKDQVDIFNYLNNKYVVPTNLPLTLDIDGINTYRVAMYVHSVYRHNQH